MVMSEGAIEYLLASVGEGLLVTKVTLNNFALFNLLLA